MKKTETSLWWLLGLLLPPVGIVLYFVWKNNSKKKANSVLKGTILGFCIYSIFILYYSTHQSDYFNRSVDTWYRDVAKKNTVVTVIGASYCQHCQEYKPHIKSLADKKNINLYFYEVDKLESEDESKLLDSYDLINYEGRVPFTVIFKDGKAIATHEGFEGEEMMYQFFVENGVIKN